MEQKDKDEEKGASHPMGRQLVICAQDKPHALEKKILAHGMLVLWCPFPSLTSKGLTQLRPKFSFSLIGFNYPIRN